MSAPGRASYRSALRWWGCEAVDDGPHLPPRWVQVRPPDCASTASVDAHLARELGNGTPPSSLVSHLSRAHAIAKAGGLAAGCCDVANALARVKAPRVDEFQPRCPPRDALRVFEGACANDAERGLVRLVFCGARPGESSSVRTHDIDQRTRSVRIVKGRGRLRKRGGGHAIHLDPETWACVSWALDHHDVLFPARGVAVADDRLFPFASTDWFAGNFMPRVRAHLGARVSLYLPGPRDGLYVLRHLGATLVAEATNGDVLAVMRYLGDRSTRAALGYVASHRSKAAAPADVIERIADLADEAPAAVVPKPAPRSKEGRRLATVHTLRPGAQPDPKAGDPHEGANAHSTTTTTEGASGAVRTPSPRAARSVRRK